jgi:hypothetical protein
MNYLSLKTLARLAPAVFALGLGATAVQAEGYTYDTGRDVTFTSTDAQVINHYQTLRQSFSCPNGMRLATFSSDGALTRNTSSSGVAAYLWDGSEGGTSLTETFTNWNASGDQTYSIAYACHGRYAPDAGITADARTSDGQPYVAGSWVNKNVVVTLTCTANGQPLIGGSFGEGANQSISSNGDGCINTGGTGALPLTFGPINVDETAPKIGYAGNSGSYTVDQTVDIACVAVDPIGSDGKAGSGLANNTCQPVQGAAYVLGLGQHDLSATATDKAGNSANASAKYTVQVTPASLKALTQQFLGATNPVQVQILGAYLDRAADPKQLTSSVNSYQQLLAAESGFSITGDQLPKAKLLTDLSRGLLTAPASNPTAVPTPAPARSSAPAQTINDTDAGLQYSGSGWGYYGGRGVGDLQDDVHATTNDGDAVSFSFRGTGVAFVTEKSLDEGQVDVLLDGQLVQTVDAFAANVHNQSGQVLFSRNDLSAGQHTVKLVKKSGAYMLLDALTIQP